HTLEFDEPLSSDGRLQGVTLMLGVGDVTDVLPSLVASVDAFLLSFETRGDGVFSPPAEIIARLPRLAAAGATAWVNTDDDAVRAGLKQAGFQVDLNRPTTSAEGDSPFTHATYTP